ncbi:hypothetical protein LCGC14_1466570 [marine sediment metagenome]|uniref:Uncharacterized protein n=1 Tax=marine sediment metagenome TaxID=412755 RepID=A0A0F9LUA0_9ZZZZ
MTEQTYPTRCRIIDVAGEVWNGIRIRTPAASRPHIGKEGTAALDGGCVRVTLDDGTVLMGYDCWWEPIT